MSFFLIFVFGLKFPVISQTYPFGEKIREVQESTWNSLKESMNKGQCETCGQPTLLGRKQCFHCLQKQAPHDFKDWLNRAYDTYKEALKRLDDPQMTDEIIEKLFEMKRQLQDSQKLDSSYEMEQKRVFFEELGKYPVGNDGKVLNELVREKLEKYLPALEGTDYIQDPAKAVSYFLVLDGKGFIENVRCIRGPLGQPMTILEAYQCYSRTDPKKARDLLEIMDNVRKLSDPNFKEEGIPLLLDSLARTLRVLTR